jgi:hypothetical protein
MRSRHCKRRQAYRRLVVATFWLSDGLRCQATNAQLARAAGISADSIRLHLREMERDGIIAVFRYPDYSFCLASHRLIVLLDHPEAADAIDAMRAYRRNAAPYLEGLAYEQEA